MTAEVLPQRYFALLNGAEKKNVPLSALVELTHACNLRCEHCYLDLLPDSKIGAMSTAEWRGIFRQLADAGCLFLTMSGGELLLRKDWFELATYARELGFALRLYTNGVLIDERTADRIASLFPLGVEISLHGATAETQDAIAQRPGSFEKTLAGARRLLDRGVPVLFKCVIMQRNHREYAAIRDLAESMGATIHFDIEVTPMNNGSRTTSALAAEKEDLMPIAREIWGAQKSCSVDLHFGFEDRLNDAPCSAGRRTCHIGPTGDLHPCTQWTTPVGSLRKHTFKELWEGSPTLGQIRKTHLKDLGGCTGCDVVDVCNPCMALSLLEHGDLEGPSDTKCRTTATRAAALGVPGKPNARPKRAPVNDGALVQLRVPGKRPTAAKTG